MIGVLAGGHQGDIPTNVIMAKQLTIKGVIVGSREDRLNMIRVIEHCIRPVLDKHFPLAQLADAFQYQESGQHFGKIIGDIGQ